MQIIYFQSIIIYQGNKLQKIEKEEIFNKINKLQFKINNLLDLIGNLIF